MKDDERALLALLADDAARAGRFADEVGGGIGIHHKRVNYILLKWADRGWWDYGVSARTGWLTREGRKAAQEVLT